MTDKLPNPGEEHTFRASPVDVINHPPHYTRSSIEPIDVIEAWQLGYHLGNVVKYISRAGFKSPDILTDLKKARWYLDRRIQKLEGADEAVNETK